MSYCRWSDLGFGCDIYAYEARDGYTIHIARNRHGEILDLPHAGETFVEPDLSSFEMRLLYLRQVGYVFPDWVLDEIQEERAAALDAAKGE